MKAKVQAAIEDARAQAHAEAGDVTTRLGGSGLLVNKVSNIAGCVDFLAAQALELLGSSVSEGESEDATCICRQPPEGHIGWSADPHCPGVPVSQEITEEMVLKAARDHHESQGHWPDAWDDLPIESRETLLSMMDHALRAALRQGSC